MLAVMKIRFSMACWLLVVAGQFAADAVPMRTDQGTTRPSVSSTVYSTSSPRNSVTTYRVTDHTTQAPTTEDWNEGHRANAVIQESDSENRWQSYKQKFDKKYESLEEEKSRQSIFENNLRVILTNNEQHDKGLRSFKMGVNQFTDMTLEEFSQKMIGHKQNSLTEARISSTSTKFTPTQQALPSTVDWRSKGYVTSVKHQHQCGACWAFTVTGALEGQVYRSTKSLVSLSEQNLLDCATPQGHNGCDGLAQPTAYDYIKSNGGIDTEESYPYTAVQSTCRFNASNVGAKITGYVTLPQRDELALKQAVATIGPITAAMNSNHTSFVNYKSGIYNESNCGETLDHAVLIVGYGTLNGVDYWLVKNSWGTSWGENGYAYMSRNLNNQCGIASYTTYPTL